MSLTGTTIYPDGYQDIENLRIVLEPVDEGHYSIYGTVAQRGKRTTGSYAFPRRTVGTRDGSDS